MKKVKLNQEPPVCPGCHKTIPGVKFISKQVLFDDGMTKMNMVSICCQGCNTSLKFDVIPIESDLLVPDKPKIEVVN